MARKARVEGRMAVGFRRTIFQDAWMRCCEEVCAVYMGFGAEGKEVGWRGCLREESGEYGTCHLDNDRGLTIEGLSLAMKESSHRMVNS